MSGKIERKPMLISCRKCGESIQVPEANQVIQDSIIVWKAICPHCNFKHFHGVF